MTWKQIFAPVALATDPCAGVLIFVVQTNRILLLQRPDGFWEVPGGHLEPGERAREGAIRELAEETGYRGHVTFDGGRKTSSNYTLFVGEVARQFPVRLSEHVNYIWADPAALPQPLHPGLASAIP